jgi:WD40 repeat protein
MVSSVGFHPSGTLVATASTDRSIKIFDIRTHKLIQHYGDAHGPPHISGQNLDGSNSSAGGVNSVYFGGNHGEWLISTGMDGLIKVSSPNSDLGRQGGTFVLYPSRPQARANYLCCILTSRRLLRDGRQRLASHGLEIQL